MRTTFLEIYLRVIPLGAKPFEVKFGFLMELVFWELFGLDGGALSLPLLEPLVALGGCVFAI